MSASLHVEKVGRVEMVIFSLTTCPSATEHRVATPKNQIEAIIEDCVLSV